MTLVPVQAFLQPEQLGSSDSWYCPHCKAHVQADKKLDLWTLPEVLVVHLKRFSFSRTRRTKLDNPVTFPLHGLDLGPYLLRQQVGMGPSDHQLQKQLHSRAPSMAPPGVLDGCLME